MSTAASEQPYTGQDPGLATQPFSGQNAGLQALSAQPLSGQGAFSYIFQHAVQLGLDPQAVLAVASKEGAGGGIGDHGTSFGPFQLHYGGAYPSSAPQGSPAESNAWAWSPAGIDYALRGIAAKARGLTGATAIWAIVNDFEHPADAGSEIAAAQGAYGSVSPSAFGSPSSSSGGGESLTDKILGASVDSLTGGAVSGLVSHIPIVGGLVSSIDSTGKFLQKITEPSFWLRVLQIAGGAGMAAIGVVLLVRQVALAGDSGSPSAIPIPSAIPVPVPV